MRKETMQSNVSVYGMKSECNITPFSGSMSTATSFVLIHENTQPCPVDYLDALVDAGPRQMPCAPS